MTPSLPCYKPLVVALFGAAVGGGCAAPSAPSAREGTAAQVSIAAAHSAPRAPGDSADAAAALPPRAGLPHDCPRAMPLPAESSFCRVEDELRAAAAIVTPPDPDEWVRDRATALLEPAAAEQAVGLDACRVLALLARRDFEQLSQLVDQKTGLCLQASKGSECRWMSPTELSRCASNAAAESWSVDTGASELPSYACAEAFEHIWLADPRVFDVPPSYNCFQRRADNNGSTIVADEPPGTVYVEYHSGFEPGHDLEWRSLWLKFAPTPDGYELLALDSHYWGI